MFSQSLGFKNIHPNFCIFCMPEPDSDSPHAHYLLFRPHTVGSPATLWAWV